MHAAKAWRLLTSALVLVGSLVSQLAAQTAGRGAAGHHTVLSADPDRALAQALATIAGTPLTLEEALHDALENATDVGLAEASIDAARGAYKKERGAFDPEIFATLERSSRDELGASFFSGADTLETDLTTASGGARVRLPFGSEISASVELLRTETNSNFANLSPEYDATGLLTLRQPLLKGFGASAAAPGRAARQELEATRQQYRDVIARVRTAVETTYWSLYASERDLATALTLRDLALALLDEAQFRASAGLIGPNQVASARVFLATQVQAVLDREEELDLVSDRLATFLNRRPGDGTGRFRSADEPPSTWPAVAEDSLIARAHAASPALLAAQRTLDAAEARFRGARWDALPQLDFVGSLGGFGLSGRARDIVFGADTLRTSIDGGAGEAVSQAVKGDFPLWSAGLALNMPLGWRADRGERDRLRAERDSAGSAYEAARRMIDADVRAANRALQHGQARLAAAGEEIAAALEQIRIGRIEFSNGRATAFELVRLGADVAGAQQRLSSALVRTARAAAEVRRYTGEAAPTAAPK